MEIIKKVIETQDVTPLLEISDFDLRYSGGGRYVLTMLSGKVPRELLIEFVERKYADNDALRLELLEFAKRI